VILDRRVIARGVPRIFHWGKTPCLPLAYAPCYSGSRDGLQGVLRGCMGCKVAKYATGFELVSGVCSSYQMTSLSSVAEGRMRTRRKLIIHICACAGKTVRSLENTTCHTSALLRWCFTKMRCIKCTYLYLYINITRISRDLSPSVHIDIIHLIAKAHQSANAKLKCFVSRDARLLNTALSLCSANI